MATTAHIKWIRRVNTNKISSHTLCAVRISCCWQNVAEFMWSLPPRNKIELNEDIRFDDSVSTISKWYVHFITFFIVLYWVFGTTKTNRYVMWWKTTFAFARRRDDGLMLREHPANADATLFIISFWLLQRKKWRRRRRKKNPSRNWRWKSICSCFFCSHLRCQ